MKSDNKSALKVLAFGAVFIAAAAFIRIGDSNGKGFGISFSAPWNRAEVVRKIDSSFKHHQPLLEKPQALPDSSKRSSFGGSSLGGHTD